MSTKPVFTVARNRERIGTSRDMAGYASAILQGPEGRKANARKATFPGLADLISRQSLCNDLSSSLYKDELYDLAKSLDLPVLKSSTKGELCALIAHYAGYQMPVPRKVKLDSAERKLKKALLINFIRYMDENTNKNGDKEEHYILSDQVKYKLNGIMNKLYKWLDEQKEFAKGSRDTPYGRFESFVYGIKSYAKPNNRDLFNEISSLQADNQKAQTITAILEAILKEIISYIEGFTLERIKYREKRTPIDGIFIILPEDLIEGMTEHYDMNDMVQALNIDL